MRPLATKPTGTAATARCPPAATGLPARSDRRQAPAHCTVVPQVDEVPPYIAQRTRRAPTGSPAWVRKASGQAITEMTAALAGLFLLASPAPISRSATAAAGSGRKNAVTS